MTARRRRFTGMKKYIFCLIVFLVGFGCSKKTTYIGKPTSDSKLSYLTVNYDASEDSTYVANAKAIGLYITNESNNKINNCQFTINDKYKAKLSSILYDYGFVKGNKPLGRNYIKPKESLWFSFSHDCFNHAVFRDEQGNVFPQSQLIDRLQLIASEGKGVWIFQEKKEP